MSGSQSDGGMARARAAGGRYWLVHPNGGRQLIDASRFDLARLAERAAQLGARIEVETAPLPAPAGAAASRAPLRFEPPVSALAALFRHRLAKVYPCRVPFDVDMNTRATTRRLGAYYHTRRLVRVYTHDGEAGRRPLEELFDTFLHEVAHHLEYTEPDSYRAERCGRVPGRMHSRLFWAILGDLKWRWAEAQRGADPPALPGETTG